MSNRKLPAPTWLQKLGPRDRREAAHLRAIGPQRFLQLARKAVSIKRSKGAQPQDDTDLIEQAVLLWLTNPDWKTCNVASLAAKRIKAESNRRLPGLVRLTDILRRGFRKLRGDSAEFPTWLVHKAESEAERQGLRTRFSDLYDAEAARLARQVRALSTGLIRAPEPPPPQPPQPKHPNPQGAAFLQAFGDILDPDMPITQAWRLFAELRHTVRVRGRVG
jgi:hypothetical protein